ncbi:hypothetical protein [Lysobacter sp. A03]|uniref:hypothetical protein n=1 Tax=Lysobacter sp. A03 TaxID=1199154 RepID=UPI0005B7392F|nr:hypothetical protein [Lysobacter sp. A03]KIQ95933.1 hypothetical protein TI01_2591 [Lysobacter sp. A03]
MNRKFNNSLSALAITGAMLVTTVVFGLSPLEVGPTTGAAVARFDAGPAPAATGQSSATPVSGASGGAVQFRQTLLMPYFSFVPRG